MKIEFSEEEANKLINLLDESVKAKGLAVANVGLYFFEKIRQAFAADLEAKKLEESESKSKEKSKIEEVLSANKESEKPNDTVADK